MTYVVTDACTACGACLLTCPEHAIAVGLPLTVRDDRCTSCGECVEVCPADAIDQLPNPDPDSDPALIYVLWPPDTLDARPEDVDRREKGAGA
jgi:ferredoxin